MKKYNLVVLGIFLIIPIVASAAWWNPFSWSIFKIAQHSELATSTQVLSKTSKEITAGNTSAEAGEKAEKKINSIGTKSKKLNPLIALLDVHIKNLRVHIAHFEKMRDFAEEAKGYAQERVDYISERNIYNDKAFNILLNFNKEAIKTYDEYALYYSNASEVYKRLVANVESQKYSPVISQATNTEAQRAEAERIISEMKSGEAKAEEVAQSDAKFIKSYENTEKMNKDMLKMLMQRYGSDMPVAQPVLLQQNFQFQNKLQTIEIPRIHTCSIGPVGGGGIELSVNCN